jgi:acetylornithine deacetylase
MAGTMQSGAGGALASANACCSTAILIPIRLQSAGPSIPGVGGLRTDNFIFGLGCSNMKAGCSAYLCAVRELIRQHVRLRGDVLITFVCGELQGGIGTLKLIERGVSADYFIVGEPTDLAALTMHAGTVDFEIELTGRTRHMSKREDAGDALAAAAALALKINELRLAGAGTEYESMIRSHVGTLHAALTPEFDRGVCRLPILLESPVRAGMRPTNRGRLSCWH